MIASLNGSNVSPSLCVNDMLMILSVIRGLMAPAEITLPTGIKLQGWFSGTA